MHALISLVGDNPQNPNIKCQDQLNLNPWMTFLKQQIFQKVEPTILGQILGWILFEDILLIKTNFFLSHYLLNTLLNSTIHRAIYQHTRHTNLS